MKTVVFKDFYIKNYPYATGDLLLYCKKCDQIIYYVNYCRKCKLVIPENILTQAKLLDVCFL